LECGCSEGSKLYLIDDTDFYPELLNEKIEKQL